jgi:photosystem II stability/assembly factor-like uncharacterized protein
VSYLRQGPCLAIVISTCLLIFATCKKEPFFAFGKLRHSALPNTSDFADLVLIDEQTAYAAGGTVWDKGQILLTTDGGLSWSLDAELPGRIEAISYHPASGTVFACGQGGGIYRKLPTESTWTVLAFDYQRWFRGATFLPNTTPTAFFVNGEAFRYGAVRSLSNQDSTPDTLYLAPNELSDIHAVTNQVLVTVGYGYVVRSTNGGQTWNRIEPTGEFFKALDFYDTSGVMVAESGRVFTTRDSGEHWEQSAKLDATLTDVCYLNLDTLYACGLGGAIYRSTDGGSLWLKAEGIPEIDWFGVQAKNQKVHLVGADGVYLQAESF